MDSKKLAQLCRDFADNKKGGKHRRARRAKTFVRDGFFRYCHGTSQPHLRAIVEEITSRCVMSMTCALPA